MITIDPGFDLLASPPYTTTLPNGGGATVTSVPLPLNSYDFGSGPVGVGSNELAPGTVVDDHAADHRQLRHGVS